jgi:hypothetical protein
LIIDHDMAMVEQVAVRITVLNFGKRITGHDDALVAPLPDVGIAGNVDQWRATHQSRMRPPAPPPHDCCIAPPEKREALIISLIPVSVPRSMPLAAAVADYQMHRTKKLKKQGR